MVDPVQPRLKLVTSTTFDDAATVVRRLAPGARAGPISEPGAARRPRRFRRFVGVTATVCALFGFAFLVADLRLETEEHLPLSGTPTLSDFLSRPAPTDQAPASRQPASGATPRRLAWAPAEGASGYRVELFRGATQVFAANTTRPEITIPAKWKLAGRERRLAPVAYRWYVWPIVPGGRTSRAVVQARLVVRDR